MIGNMKPKAKRTEAGFIQRAAKTNHGGIKIPVMIRLDLDARDRLDRVAKKLGISRSALIASTLAKVDLE